MKYAVIGVLAVVVVAVGAWGLAAPTKADSASARPRAGRYEVAGTPTGPMLLDTITGNTWTLARSAAGTECAWLPTRKIDDLKDAKKWQSFQKLMQKQMTEKRR